ncbi:MAG: 2-oxo acid dehydrogenase subunit E2 [Planctomycetales bacterium]|nr:2-oxo acid dehydrogenase subunit E2 [Planctomycetales bacterium]
MAIEITIPRLGWSMEEGIFVGWTKQDGDAVKPGDVLFSLEGDKAIQEIECLDAGILRIPAAAPQPGATVKVGVVVGYVVQPGEQISSVNGPAFVADAASVRIQSQTDSYVDASCVGHDSTPASPAVRRLAREVGVELQLVAGSGPGGRVTEHDVRQFVEQSTLAARQEPRPPGVTATTSSPRARRVARELGVDWKQLRGSGSTGRVRERDVRAAAANGQRATAPTRLPISPLRRQIADRLRISVQTTVPVTLTSTADATNLVNLRQQFQAAATTADDPVPSYTDFLVKLTAAALQQHPLLNSQWTDDAIVLHNEIHIGVAVDSDAGLLVPVLRNVPTLSLRQLAVQSRDLVTRTRQRTLRPDELQGGTFTVTNLGAFGIDAFTPVINPPQCAVLGIGRIAKRPAIVMDQVLPRDLVTLSLTFDHRILDGAPAARFLQSLVTMVENPSPWLMP